MVIYIYGYSSFIFCLSPLLYFFFPNCIFSFFYRFLFCVLFLIKFIPFKFIFSSLKVLILNCCCYYWYSLGLQFFYNFFIVIMYRIIYNIFEICLTKKKTLFKKMNSSELFFLLNERSFLCTVQLLYCFF